MITSVSNSQVKNLINLQKKAKLRREQGVYVVEGIRMFREIPEGLLQQIYVSESFLADNEELMAGKTYEVLADNVFAHVSDTQTPQGVLGLVKTMRYELSDVLKDHPDDGLYLILESIQDPGNLGTMFRTAEGAGASCIIMDKNTVDMYNPKTVRSTMGSAYRVPFVISEDLAETVRFLKENGVKTYAAHLEGSVVYDSPDYKGPSAFMIGNEGNGLTDGLSKLSDQYIRIPMGGHLESLNAAMAAGILMYEANRQRRN